MTDHQDQGWAWEVAGNAAEVHALLEASDLAHRENGPVPQRNWTATQKLVESGCVHLLRCQGSPAAMFTITESPPFDTRGAGFEPARTPRYLQRLAVDPVLVGRLGPFPAMSAIRKLMEVASRQGADAVRSEANPDIVQVVRLLTAMGFRERARSVGPEGRPRVYLELLL